MAKNKQKEALEILGSRIRYYRKLRSLSQQSLASKLNVAWETISRWENGKVSPLHKLSDVANALQIPVTYLLSENNLPIEQEDTRYTGIPYVGDFPKTYDGLLQTFNHTLFRLDLSRTFPPDSFAIKSSRNLTNKTNIPINDNTIFIVNADIAKTASFYIYYNDKRHFILTTKKNKTYGKLVLRAVAIILQ